jgi:hypothetical protein
MFHELYVYERTWTSLGVWTTVADAQRYAAARDARVHAEARTCWREYDAGLIGYPQGSPDMLRYVITSREGTE